MLVIFFLPQDSSLVLTLLLPLVILLVNILKCVISTRDSRREFYMLHENEKIVNPFGVARLF